MTADPKPPPRVRDGTLLKALHRRWQECSLCHGTAYTEGRLSLHHVHRHPRDDVEGNLVMLCGDGTRGCHGRIEANDPVALSLLGAHIVSERPDTILYLRAKLGDGADGWMQRRLLIEEAP